MKLNKTQLDVLTRMAEGWELGSFNGECTNHNMIQYGGLGKGGISVDVSNATILSLVKKGLIATAAMRSPYSTWRLTDKGHHAISQ